MPYVVEGRLVNGRLAVAVRFGADRGTATLWKVTAWFRVARQLRPIRDGAVRRLEPFVVPWVRRRRAALRPSGAVNRQRLQVRGETIVYLLWDYHRLGLERRHLT